jgi:DNA-3-methyladenine glycosylase
MANPSSTVASSSKAAERAWACRFQAPWPREFYDRPPTVVARELVGQGLLRRGPEGWRVGRIVETEAYGSGDLASHAFRGPTPRNRSMFAGPGRLYVYRIHQVYCANAVTRRGEAVLLRAVEPLFGALSNPSGPGRLCREFGLTMADDGIDLVEGEVRLIPMPRVGRVVQGPRVGVSRATTVRWRFASGESRWVSRPRPPGWKAPRRNPAT